MVLSEEQTNSHTHTPRSSRENSRKPRGDQRVSCLSDGNNEGQLCRCEQWPLEVYGGDEHGNEGTGGDVWKKHVYIFESVHIGVI